MWYRIGMEIFSHWQTPAWLDLYGREMRDCFPGMKYRIGKREKKEREEGRKRERGRARELGGRSHGS